MKLAGKIAIITGSGRGIGRAIAHAFGRQGAKVVIADIHNESAEKVSLELNQAGVENITIQVDIANASQVEEMVKTTLETFSTVDILVNNAGIFTYTPIEECSEEEWDGILAVNLKGAFLCSKAVMNQMKSQRSGKIINIASISGKVGGLVASVPYAVSKAGVICLTKSFAKALAPYGINVNCISPGVIETDMTARHPDMRDMVPLGRIGQPEDIAACAVYLASADSDYLTGEIIDVDGGMSMD